MCPWNLAHIIVLVNVTFLVLIALPLGVYLLLILFHTFEIGIAVAIAPDHQIGAEGSSAENAPEQSTPRAASDLISLLESGSLEPASARPSDGSIPVAGSPPELAPAALAPLQHEIVLPVSAAPVPSPAAASPAVATVPPALAETLAEPSAAQIETEPTAAAPAPEIPSVAVKQTPTTLPMENEPDEAQDSDPILPEGPLILADKGSPKYAFDYRGRLWIDKKHKSFFRQLRRPRLPPEEPQ